ncbi:MAG: hypothetical protein WD468_02605 [Pirellulales bacterium]
MIAVHEPPLSPAQGAVPDASHALKGDFEANPADIELPAKAWR